MAISGSVKSAPKPNGIQLGLTLANLGPLSDVTQCYLRGRRHVDTGGEQDFLNCRMNDVRAFLTRRCRAHWYRDNVYVLLGFMTQIDQK
jgi:hypothetical protein